MLKEEYREIMHEFKPSAAPRPYDFVWKIHINSINDNATIYIDAKERLEKKVLFFLECLYDIYTHYFLAKTPIPPSWPTYIGLLGLQDVEYKLLDFKETVAIIDSWVNNNIDDIEGINLQFLKQSQYENAYRISAPALSQDYEYIIIEEKKRFVLFFGESFH